LITAYWVNDNHPAWSVRRAEERATPEGASERVLSQFGRPLSVSFFVTPRFIAVPEGIHPVPSNRFNGLRFPEGTNR
jgi:hypothetical protein